MTQIRVGFRSPLILLPSLVTYSLWKPFSFMAVVVTAPLLRSFIQQAFGDHLFFARL